jgi:hypothetical protein
MRKVTMVNGWHEFQVEPFQSHMFRGDVKFEGPLQVRIPYSNVWKQLHVVVTSKYGTEAYASNAGISKKIFKRKASMVDLSKRGSILFYPNKNTAAKGKPPLFVMYDVKWVNTIWPDEADEVKIEHLCMAKLQGSFRLYSLKQNDDLQLGRKTFENFAKGYPTMTGLETFAALFEGTDPRPVPEQLLIMTPSSADLSRWITAIWCSFSIDPAVAQLEDEIHEMTKLPDPPEGQVQPDMVKVEWPTQMYLSLNEVGGITMNPVSLFETFVQYSHYLQQKVNFSKQQKIRQWCEAVAKGEWERNICDRKEIDYKIKQLVDWSLKICEKLNQFGIETKKPHPTVLVAAMSSIVGWIGPVLSSMIDETPKSPIKSSPSTSATTSTSDSGDVETSSSVSKPSTKKTVTTSGSEGSVSEEERSDDGSQSDGESEESLEQVFHID